MRDCLPVILVLLTLNSASAATARRVISTVTHPTVYAYSAGPGGSQGAFPHEMGLNGRQGDAITSSPGVLSIVPGERWSNFVTAVREGVPYTLKSVVLTIDFPADWYYTGRTVVQVGDANIRLWWPLLYETPNTTWTLAILYGTADLWDDDGPGPNTTAHIHKEVWRWRLGRTQESLEHLLAVFHHAPFGRSGTPLVSDEVLYAQLRDRLENLDLPPEPDCICPGTEQSQAVGEFEMQLLDACIANSAAYPNPTGPGTGVANTDENPATVRLLQDAERLLCICCFP